MHVNLTSTKGCWVSSSGLYLEKNYWGGGGGANMDCVAKGHCEGECAGGGCAPSCAEREAETTSILQSEWEAKKEVH